MDNDGLLDRISFSTRIIPYKVNCFDKVAGLYSINNSNVDPAQIRELEASKEMLKFWEKQLKSMAWNVENEDGTMIRTVDQPHQEVLKLIREVSKSIGFPTSRHDLLDKLQVKLIVQADRIDVKALLPIEPIISQPCTSARRIRR